MRLAVLSDIHGNYRALQAVLEDVERQQIDDIISLGDTIGYGPEPESVVVELKKRGIDSVMGNHELALASTSYFKRLNFLTRESLDITRSLLSKSSLSWLVSLPPLMTRPGVRFCHGCPPSSITQYLYEPSETRLQRIFQGYGEPLCFSGHTHMLNLFIKHHTGKISSQPLPLEPIKLEPQNRYIIIGGSVGQPRDNLNNRAKYVIWDSSTGSCTLRQVVYDVDTTINLLKQLHFPSHNARRLKWSRNENQ